MSKSDEILDNEPCSLCALCDLNYVHGLKRGWNLGVEEDATKLEAEIEARQQPALAVLKKLSPAQPTEQKDG